MINNKRIDITKRPPIIFTLHDSTSASRKVPHSDPWCIKFLGRMLVDFFFMARQPLEGYGLLSIEVSLLRSGTPHSGGLFCKTDRPFAETSTRKHTALSRDNHPRPRRDSNPQSQQASVRRSTN